ncbi:hypothetical protein FRC12_000269 [Ceratobasidium sp. 428]|nr:hypothetical protein FRC12_000269 [Ceratobasidium sp. 428]
MPAYHWAGGGDSSLLDETLAKMVSVIQKHSERTLILQTPALCAFVVGCSHYLVTHASKKDQRETVRQLILVLLRLNSATARSSDRLRYTIAVTLASSAAAGRLYRQMSMPAAAATGQLYHQMSQLLSTGETSTTRGARLFAEYIHQGAEPSDRYSTTAEQLLYFGVLGISHLLPFASVDSRLTSSLSGLAPRSLRDQPGFITLKTIPQHLTWDQLKIQAGLGCLKQVPKLNGSLDAEIALARYLQQVVRRINLTEPKAGLDQAALAAISAMCHARSTELWDCSLNALGLEIKDAEHLSDPHLDLVTRLRLAEHLFQVSIALNPCSSPPAMRRLWDLILLILRSTGLAPRDRLRALGSLPERCGLEGRQHLTTTHGLPHSIDDLQLEPVWYQTLESMISSGHAPEMDGKIIQVMIEHYRGEASAANNKGGILQKWLNLDASFKSEKKIRARKRWNVSLIVLRCIVRLRSRRQEDTLTSELDAVAL